MSYMSELFGLMIITEMTHSHKALWIGQREWHGFREYTQSKSVIINGLHISKANFVGMSEYHTQLK